jgi:transcription elongation factor Elf1
MNCWHCKHELIWDCDHDLDDEECSMVTNLHCPNCGCSVDVWYPKENEDE